VLYFVIVYGHYLKLIGPSTLIIVQVKSQLYLVTVFVLISLSSCSEEHHGRIDNITVEVTGEEYNWYFRYPGEDGELGTEDDKFSKQNLYLPDNTNVTLNLKSKDYVYNVTLPEIGKKEIAVPDLEFSLHFTTQGESTWEFKGDQFCGFSHETLIGKVFIREQASEGFYTW